MPDVSSTMASVVLSFAVVVAFLTTSSELVHWFVFPVFGCGVLIGIDAIRWLRGRLDTFDPVGVLGLFGFYFFFVAPLLHVAADYWMGSVTPPPDWRDWLGGMAMLNLAGLVAYRVGRTRAFARPGSGATRSVWIVAGTRLPLVFGSALVFALVLQLWVYARHGGIEGYVATYVSRAEERAFGGFGWLFGISESFPILAFMAYALWQSRRAKTPRWTSLIAVGFVFLLLQFLFGGLRGSRGNTVWAVVWAAGIIHFILRPIPRRAIGVGLGAFLLFMYGYSLYKGAGLDALAALTNAEERRRLSDETGRTLMATLLADLGRSDVQAYVLYSVTDSKGDYEFAWGRTYIGALALLIPRAMWPERPMTKVVEGTEALYGRGSYKPGQFRSTRIYGLAGEAMLNFGPAVVPIAFFVWGMVVGWVRKMCSVLDAQDSRRLIVPFLIVTCVVAMANDSDNLLFVTIKNAALPSLVVFLISSRRRRLTATSMAARSGPSVLRR